MSSFDVCAYEVTMYGRDDFGQPVAAEWTKEAMTPAGALIEPGWTVEAVRHGEPARGYPVVSYRIRRSGGGGDIIIERTASDPTLWLVSLPTSSGWIGTVCEK